LVRYPVAILVVTATQGACPHRQQYWVTTCSWPNSNRRGPRP